MARHTYEVLPNAMPLKPMFDHPFDQFAKYHGEPFTVVAGPYNVHMELVSSEEANRLLASDNDETDLIYEIRFNDGRVIQALIEEIHAEFSWLGRNVNDTRTPEERERVSYG